MRSHFPLKACARFCCNGGAIESAESEYRRASPLWRGPTETRKDHCHVKLHSSKPWMPAKVSTHTWNSDKSHKYRFQTDTIYHRPRQMWYETWNYVPNRRCMFRSPGSKKCFQISRSYWLGILICGLPWNAGSRSNNLKIGFRWLRKMNSTTIKEHGSRSYERGRAIPIKL